MKLSLTDSQILLCDTVARLFADESTTSRVRAAEGTGGFDAALWGKALDIGLITMRGEGAASLLDASLVAEEAGRRLASIPIVEAMVAAALLQRAGAKPTLVDRVTSGEVVTLALTPLVPSRPQLVPGAAKARLILALDGDDLVAIEGAGDVGAARVIASSPAAMIDLSQVAQARTVLASGAAARTLYAGAIEEWKLLSAAMLAGIGRRALELAGAYSAERIQFDRPIGSFQGVAHPLADSATEIDGAQLLVRRAIWATAKGRADASESIAMAWWWAGRATDRAVARSVRAFGGYGVSLEYDVQLYFRRAKFVALLLGDPQAELDLIAARLFDGEAGALPDAGEIDLDFGYGPSADAYAAELRRFVESNMTAEVLEKKHYSTSGHHPGFHKKLAAAGFAFPEFSVEGGSAPRSRYEVMAGAELWEDMAWTRVPTAVTEMLGKLAQIWSQPQAKAEILSKIIAGEALGAIGLSEPGAGSDVFAARFSAVRDGEQWILNGQKMFTTNAHNADYIIMLTRTSSEGKKHQGLTMFIMPLRLPGVEIRAVYTLQDERTNIVHFSDVRVADVYRIGEVHGGAKVMASALQIEQGGLDYHFAQMAMMRRAVAWATRTRPDSTAPIANGATRRVLARAATHSRVSEVLGRRALWGAVEGCYEISWGPMAKLFTTESLMADAAAIIDLAAPASLVRGLDEDIDVVETMMRRSIAMTIYGGTSEVHRSIIAENSLRMPKSRA